MRSPAFAGVVTAKKKEKRGNPLLFYAVVKINNQTKLQAYH